jgi:hypothetical protein
MAAICYIMFTASNAVAAYLLVELSLGSIKASIIKESAGNETESPMIRAKITRLDLDDFVP